MAVLGVVLATNLYLAIKNWRLSKQWQLIGRQNDRVMRKLARYERLLIRRAEILRLGEAAQRAEHEAAQEKSSTLH